MKNIYRENFEPIKTLDYKGYHIRFYIIGSSTDVGIFLNKKSVLTLCDFKTLKEATSMSKYRINEGEFDIDDNYEININELQKQYVKDNYERLKANGWIK